MEVLFWPLAIGRRTWESETACLIVNGGVQTDATAGSVGGARMKDRPSFTPLGSPMRSPKNRKAPPEFGYLKGRVRRKDPYCRMGYQVDQPTLQMVRQWCYHHVCEERTCSFQKA